MGPLPTVILVACLGVLRWLLFVTAALMCALLIVQYLRGDADAMPVQLGAGAVGMVLLGVVCGRAAAWFERGAS